MTLRGVALWVAVVCLVLGLLLVRMMDGRQAAGQGAGVGWGASPVTEARDTSLGHALPPVVWPSYPVVVSPYHYRIVGPPDDSTVEASPPTSSAGSIPAGSTMPRTIRVILALQASPWPDWSHATVLDIARCESTLKPTAVGDDGLALGLMQIRTDYHPHLHAQYDLLDLHENLEAAWDVYQRQGWPAWSCAR